jgi:hypothetical protein
MPPLAWVEREVIFRSPPRKVTYFEPVSPRLARNTIIESTFEVGRRFRCTMRVDSGQLDEEELVDWRAGRSAVYQPPYLERRRFVPIKHNVINLRLESALKPGPLHSVT